MNKEDFKKMYPNVSDKIIDEALAYPDKLARELISVQPMDTPEIKEALTSLFTLGKSEKQLIAEGYKPVDEQTRLMWVKKERVPPGE